MGLNEPLCEAPPQTPSCSQCWGAQWEGPMGGPSTVLVDRHRLEVPVQHDQRAGGVEPDSPYLALVDTLGQPLKRDTHCVETTQHENKVNVHELILVH